MSTLGSGNGNPQARIMLVGEAWGEEEARQQRPFVGASGLELNRILQSAGIARSECWVTNLVNARPKGNDMGEWIAARKKDLTPDHVRLRDRWVLPIVYDGHEALLREIDLVKPNLIVTLGNYPLWALTGAWGVLKWRGSYLDAEGLPKLISTIHPAAVLREWSLRPLLMADLKRANRERHRPAWVDPKPQWEFKLRPTFVEVEATLHSLMHELDKREVWLDLDLETRAGHIACCGLSWSTLHALVIPLMCVEREEGYWTSEEEAQIVGMLQAVLTHERVRIRWQNGLYDAQYIHRHWGFLPRHAQDTMIAQHSAFVSMPKSLGFISSLYSPHPFWWKDEGKTWSKNQSEDQLWHYNGQDCVRTRECGEALTPMLAKMGLAEVDAFQQRLFTPVLQAMLWGVRVDPERRRSLADGLTTAINERERFVRDLVGEVNLRSTKQMQALFYHDLGQRPVMTRATKKAPARVTMNDEALTTIGQREPLLRPLTNAIADIRTLTKWRDDFALMRLDTDGRMRCSFNIAGNAEAGSAPYTYRLSSSANAFGTGGNLQTIPSDKSRSAGKAAARGTDIVIPNLRSMFVPDPGMLFFDTDLDRADLQVVVAEADDKDLRYVLDNGVDIHLFNAFVVSGKEPPPLDELVETHPRYADHRSPMKYAREFAKQFCHGTNYGGKGRTLAAATGRTAAEIERAQRLWFGAHPGILRWHKRVQAELERYQEVRNKFGYRWHVFDRIDAAFTAALAWIPQSTVGCLINRIWLKWWDELPEVQVLLQVHDSLAGQFPAALADTLPAKMLAMGRIAIPYPTPLIIPLGIGTSATSWGDC